eukprot:TRINITY_DN18935_c0_g2_i1.p1 TRINITY_DN18935_c0_g2~~TRINITY_DN18935_c0_g2_i1.p1  ORF type:complete len:468 (-),score=127.40 TRINITY_DN18935_c0_g2_i1:722-2125(-)
MCIRDRYQRRVRGRSAMAQWSRSSERATDLQRSDSGFSRILEGKAGRSNAARNAEMNELAVMQAWVNEKLDGDFVVTDVVEELKTGVILCRLCERLTGKRIRARNQQLHVFHMDNVNQSLKVLRRLGCEVSFGADLIVSGNAKYTLTLLKTMQQHFDRGGVDHIAPGVIVSNNDTGAEPLPAMAVPAVGRGVDDWNGDRSESNALQQRQARIDALERKRTAAEKAEIVRATSSSQRGQSAGSGVEEAWLMNTRAKWTRAISLVGERRARAVGVWEELLAWAKAEVAGRTADGDAGEQGHLNPGQLERIESMYADFQQAPARLVIPDEYKTEFGEEPFQRYADMGFLDVESLVLAIRLARRCKHSDPEDEWHTGLNLLLGKSIKYVDENSEIMEATLTDNELVLRDGSEIVQSGAEEYAAQAAQTPYEEELMQLHMMGFTDFDQNRTALDKVSASPYRLQAATRYLTA